jgi:hypothetical protein
VPSRAVLASTIHFLLYAKCNEAWSRNGAVHFIRNSFLSFSLFYQSLQFIYLILFPTVQFGSYNTSCSGSAFNASDFNVSASQMGCSNSISGYVQGLTAHFIKPIKRRRLRFNVRGLYFLKKKCNSWKNSQCLWHAILKILLTKFALYWVPITAINMSGFQAF